MFSIFQILDFKEKLHEITFQIASLEAKKPCLKGIPTIKATG
jgi:hypothetical protein